MIRPRRSQDAEAVKAKADDATVTARVAAVFLSLSLIFHGCYNLLARNNDAALADFAGALGTAGLPRWWFRGWTITFPDRQPPGKAEPLASIEAIRAAPTTCGWVVDTDSITEDDIRGGGK
jgi:hypothetical protein